MLNDETGVPCPGSNASAIPTLSNVSTPVSRHLAARPMFLAHGTDWMTSLLPTSSKDRISILTAISSCGTATLYGHTSKPSVRNAATKALPHTGIGLFLQTIHVRRPCLTEARPPCQAMARQYLMAELTLQPSDSTSPSRPVLEVVVSGMGRLPTCRYVADMQLANPHTPLSLCITRFPNAYPSRLTSA